MRELGMKKSAIAGKGTASGINRCYRPFCECLAKLLQFVDQPKW